MEYSAGLHNFGQILSLKVNGEEVCENVLVLFDCYFFSYLSFEFSTLSSASKHLLQFLVVLNSSCLMTIVFGRCLMKRLIGLSPGERRCPLTAELAGVVQSPMKTTFVFLSLLFLSLLGALLS